MAEQEAIEAALEAMEAIKRKVDRDLQMSDDEGEKDDRKNEPESSVVLSVLGKDNTEREPAQVADVQPVEVVEVVEAKPARFNGIIARMDAAVKDTVTHGLKVAVAAEKNGVTEEELVEELQNRGLIERLNAKQLLSRRQPSTLREPVVVKRRGRPSKDCMKEKNGGEVIDVDGSDVETLPIVTIQTRKKGGRKGRELGDDASDDSWTASGRPVKKSRLKAGVTAPISQARSVRASTSNQLKQLNQAKTRQVSLPKTAPTKHDSPEIPVQVSKSPRATGQKRVLEVEKIVEIRQVRQYLVKWKGENEMTWENEDIFKGSKRAHQFNFKL